MHLKAVRNWIIIYMGLACFDMIVTAIFVSQERFGIDYERNPVIKALMEQYGIWQGLTFYLMQEFALFFLLWGSFYYVIRTLLKNRTEEIQYKVDIIIFNLAMPFTIMASALVHLFGGVPWLFLGLMGRVDPIDPLQLIVYVTMLCGLLQAYHIYKLNSIAH
jgi:hypothetical protein